MLIGGDDINILVMTQLPLARVFNVCLHLRSFLLLADWRNSDSSVDGSHRGIRGGIQFPET